MGNTVHRTLPDTSPPARLLATRPCCGPGPERRPVLGEAPRFHAQAKGKNVRLDGHSRRATRRNSFCNGVTFTQRPIRLYEQVRLRLVAVRPGWSGALRFGFTAHDPSLMSAQDIPKYACPDLVTRPGYWAKALPENLALRDTVLAYWADRHGRVFYSVNDGEPVLFHCGVAVGGPLWALIDVYGITDEVQLLGFVTCAGGHGCCGRSAFGLYRLPPESSRTQSGRVHLNSPFCQGEDLPCNVIFSQVRSPPGALRKSFSCSSDTQGGRCSWTFINPSHSRFIKLTLQPPCSTSRAMVSILFPGLSLRAPVTSPRL